MHCAMCGKISSLPKHSQLLNIKGLIGNREVDGLLIMQFDLFDFERQSIEITLRYPA